MLLKRKKPEDKNDADRQLVLNYKKFFSTEDGKQVLFDLMNKYHVLNSHGGEPFKEGQRSVVLGILRQCHVDMVQFDKILKGEL